jgi:hypothetical protein
MTVFTKTVTLLCCAVAAVFAAFLSTPAAAQSAGYVMPANCGDDTNKCSIQIWTRNSFPHAGVTRSVTFTNGRTLTCTSNGANTPRTCDLSPAGSGAPPSSGEAFSQEGSGPSTTPADAATAECTYLPNEASRLIEENANALDPVDADRAYFGRVMDMTPAEVEKEIQYAQSRVRGNSPDDRQRMNSRLDFLLDLRAQLAAAGAGGATTQQMEAKYQKLLNNELNYAVNRRRANTLLIEGIQKRMAELGCDHPGAP